MIKTNFVFLNKEDSVRNVSVVNNFGNIQYQVYFDTTPDMIIIDKEILDQINEKINK
jgi:hypothetical protein